MNPFVIGLVAGMNVAAWAVAQSLPYVIVDTGQDRCFGVDREIAYPRPGDAFDGQDAQYQGRLPAYRDNSDGTVSDLNTGLMWQKADSDQAMDCRPRLPMPRN